MALDLIIASGIIAFLLLFFAHQVNEQDHWAWRFIVYSFAVIIFILIAKGSIDGTITCEQLLNQTVENTTTNTTTYEYSRVCYSNTDSTSSVTLYRLILGLVGIYFMYIFVFFVWKMLHKAADSWRKR